MKKKKPAPETALPSSIADLTPSPINPRTITEDAFRGLQSSVEEFGDISGIVYNTRLGCLVSGHQRVAALRRKFGDGLTIKPTGDGNGVLETPSGSFRVRFVEWDETKSNAAMMVANNAAIQGDWTDSAAELLEQLKADTGNLFDGLKLDSLLTDLQDALKAPEPPEEFQSVGVDLVTNYTCPKCSYRWSGKKASDSGTKEDKS